MENELLKQVFYLAVVFAGMCLLFYAIIKTADWDPENQRKDLNSELLPPIMKFNNDRDEAIRELIESAKQAAADVETNPHVKITLKRSIRKIEEYV